MDTTFLRRPSAWLLAVALGVSSFSALAQQGTPEERAKVLAQLNAAVAAVQAAGTALESSQRKLATARAHLEAADTARLDAERQLKTSEAGAARGRLTRAQVDADRALADKAAEAVQAVRSELAAVEAELASNQARLTAANAAVEAASASAAAYLGDTPAD